VIERDIGEGVAIAAERVFENRIEGDQRIVALEDIAGVQYSGYFQTHGFRFGHVDAILQALHDRAHADARADFTPRP
jgi:hypothetical protein